jgi:iron complex transport system ATP-binding protein
MAKALISFQNISFAWWNPDAPENHSERTIDDLTIVFDDFSLDIPAGITSVLGQNGIGKSSLLMLGGARLFPQKGKVLIDDEDSFTFLEAPKNPGLEEYRNRLVSFVYQNMEFDSDDNIGTLFETVAAQAGESGAAGRAANPTGRNAGTGSPAGIPSDMIRALELGPVLHKKTQELAKGDLQRAVIGLALCYGSRILIMDEPVFAMEDRHKQAAFEYVRSHCLSTGTHMVYTAHDIQLCRDYADTMVLIHKDKSVLTGPVAEICTDRNLEEAYGVPIETLHKREHLYREMLRNREMQ